MTIERPPERVRMVQASVSRPRRRTGDGKDTPPAMGAEGAARVRPRSPDRRAGLRAVLLPSLFLFASAAGGALVTAFGLAAMLGR